MKKYLYALSLLLFYVIIIQKTIAENAVFDSSSKTLTIPNVEFENDTSLYNVKLQLKSNGDLSLLNIEKISAQNSEGNEDSEFLYSADSNPFLYSYMALANNLEFPSNENSETIEITKSIGENETIDPQTIFSSKKWDKKDVPGVYNRNEFTFYEDGTGSISCNNPLETTLCQQDSVPFIWTIDNYGNLVFGTTVNDIFFRFIWTILEENENNFTIYSQTIKLNKVVDSSNFGNYISGFDIQKLTKQ